MVKRVGPDERPPENFRNRAILAWHDHLLLKAMHGAYIGLPMSLCRRLADASSPLFALAKAVA
jgi:hypothetical protein